jgi:hypothetical protein
MQCARELTGKKLGVRAEVWSAPAHHRREKFRKSPPPLARVTESSKWTSNANFLPFRRIYNLLKSMMVMQRREVLARRFPCRNCTASEIFPCEAVERSRTISSRNRGNFRRAEEAG